MFFLSHSLLLLQVGTPICIPQRDFIDIGRIASIENNKKPVDTAKKGNKVAIKVGYQTFGIFFIDIKLLAYSLMILLANMTFVFPITSCGTL